MRNLEKINGWLATKMADYLATLAMFYGVTILTLSILLFQAPRSPLEWVQYAVQTFFQGVALPVLAFVAKISGEQQEKLLRETHDAVMKGIEGIKELLAKVNRIECEESRFEVELNDFGKGPLSNRSFPQGQLKDKQQGTDGIDAILRAKTIL